MEEPISSRPLFLHYRESGAMKLNCSVKHILIKKEDRSLSPESPQKMREALREVLHNNPELSTSANMDAVKLGAKLNSSDFL